MTRASAPGVATRFMTWLDSFCRAGTEPIARASDWLLDRIRRGRDQS